MDDTKIIELFWNRDEKAIEATANKYGRKLYQLANGILRNEEDAEESVNDTYLKAWNTIPPQRPKYYFAYLSKICRNLSFGKLDWSHAQKRNAQIVELTSEMELCIPNFHNEARIEDEEIGKLLNRFLDTLSQEHRLIFIRRYWYLDSIQEISKRYNMSESNIKTRLHRTRTKLKKFLEREGIYL